ncbi:MAG: hypothetical protein EA400_11170 [Chromatiaceae bacterium]|nr:MAG: hypothetical protein EA400_11170 [Chromatiaceae bacterium]
MMSQLQTRLQTQVRALVGSLVGEGSARVQVGALYLLALSAFLAPAGVATALVLLWVGLALGWWQQRGLPPGAQVATAGLWLALGLALWALLAALLAALASTGLATENAATAWARTGSLSAAPTAAYTLDRGLAWAQLAGCVPAAVALGGNERRLVRLLLLALLGLLLGILWRQDWALLGSDLQRFMISRQGFGFPAIVFALFAGTALLGLLVLRERCWGQCGGPHRGQRWLLWVLAILAIAQVFVLALSRGAWLAFLVTLGLAAVLHWRQRLQQRRQARQYHPNGSAAGAPAPQRPARALALALALLVIGLNAGPIVDRLGQEWDEVQAILDSGEAFMPSSSLGYRWQAQWFGLARWRERPWLGWGPGASPLLLARHADEGFLVKDDASLRHLHNTYLEVLVQLGLIGLLLWLALLLALLRGLAAAVTASRLSPDLGRFLGLALVFMAVWGLFDFHALSQAWRGYWALLAGSALSFALYRDQHRDRSCASR